MTGTEAACAKSTSMLNFPVPYFLLYIHPNNNKTLFIYNSHKFFKPEKYEVSK